MGLGDNKSTRKMRRRKAQKKLQERILRHRVEAAKTRAQAKPATTKRTKSAS